MQRFYQPLSSCFAMGGFWCVRLTYMYIAAENLLTSDLSLEVFSISRILD